MATVTADPMDLSPVGKGKGGKRGKSKGKGDKTTKPKDCFYCGKPGRSKSGCRNFLVALKNKAVQPELDPETGKRKSFCGTGSSAPALALGLDACLLHKEDSDPDACLFPLPMIDEGDDSPEDLTALSRQVLFDQCAHRRSDPTFPLNRRRRSSCTKQMARTWHFGSKFLSMGVGNQKIEGTVAVRNLTKPIVAAGQVTDKVQRVWLSDDDGYILDMRSAKKIERLLGDKSSFIELMTRHQVSSRWSRRSRNSEARWTKVMLRSSEKDRDEHEVTHATFRSWCEACVAGRATEDSHKRSTIESPVPLVAMDCGFLGRDTDADLVTILVLVQRPHGAVGSLSRASKAT